MPDDNAVAALNDIFSGAAKNRCMRGCGKLMLVKAAAAKR
jgi:hypothetical protein